MTPGCCHAGTQVLQVTQDCEQWLHVGMVKAAPKLLLGLQQLVFPSHSSSNPVAKLSPKPQEHTSSGADWSNKGNWRQKLGWQQLPTGALMSRH
jgi:hypothetical protein